MPAPMTLYFEQASSIAAVACSLIVAGLLKGTIGVGMPVVALPLLSLFIDVKSAAMLLSMPLVLSNLQQALEGGKTGQCLMQLIRVFLGMIPGLFLGVRVLLAVDANAARTIAGVVLMGVGGITLLAPELRLQSRLLLPTGITFGFFGGTLGGIAAMSGPLVFIFMLAKGLRGKAFTKGSITVSRRFLRLAGNSSDGQRRVQLASRFSLDGCDVASHARHVRWTPYAR
jgi:hypothetical protein